MAAYQDSSSPGESGLGQLWQRLVGMSVPSSGTQRDMLPPSPNIPGSEDRNRFWNPDSNIAPYNPPGVTDDRSQQAGGGFLNTVLGIGSAQAAEGKTTAQSLGLAPPAQGKVTAESLGLQPPQNQASPDEGIVSQFGHGLAGDKATSIAGNVGAGIRAGFPAITALQGAWNGLIGNAPPQTTDALSKVATLPEKAGYFGGQQVRGVGSLIQRVMNPATQERVMAGGGTPEEKVDLFSAASMGVGTSPGAAGEARLAQRINPDPAIQRNFAQGVKPGTAGQTSAGTVDASQAHVRSAVDSIIQNKADLSYEIPGGGTIRGRTPRTLDQFTDAIAQTKTKLFKQYDEMAETATGAQLGVNTKVPKFNDAFDAAARQASMAQRDLDAAERAVTLAKARQSRAGDNVYSSSAANTKLKEATNKLANAQIAFNKAQAAKEAAQKQLGGVWVDLAPTVRELNSFANSTIATIRPEVAQYARGLAQRLSTKAAWSPRQAQEAIQQYNASLKSFYRNPSYEKTSNAGIDALVVNRLRRATDEAIEQATAPGYQGLKNQYGALSAIEQQVTRAALREAQRTSGGGGLFGSLMNVMSAEELTSALVTMSPEPLARAAIMKGAYAMARRLRSPDRAISKMFDAAERPQRPIGQVPLPQDILQGVPQGFGP